MYAVRYLTKFIKISMYMILWGFILLFSELVYINGIYFVFTDLFGKWILIFGYLVAIVLMLLPIILSIKCYITKSEIRYIFIKSYVATFLFVVLAFASFFLVAGYYRDFTKEKWNEYPNERYIMIDDLIAEHNLLELTPKEVCNLLGEPNECLVYDNGELYIYKYGKYGVIHIAFNCGEVRSVSVS